MNRSRLIIFLTSIVSFALNPLAGPVVAQSGQRCFAETGLCISGPIRSYWERNGGLPVFGLPITEQREEIAEGRMLQVQWFERDRIEIQADGLVTAGRLGVERLAQLGIDWQQLPRDTGPAPGCRWFQETRRNLCPPFLSYWERNGGLARFGYPVTGLQSETQAGGTYTVQYFERRRMEEHPEHAGTPYVVLLGLLGREVRAVAAGDGCGYRSPLLQRTISIYLGDGACFTPYNGSDERTTIAAQPFQGGELIWLPPANANPGKLLVIFHRQGAPGAWSLYIDDYRESEQLPATTPPPGLFAPVRGFGKLWHTVPEVRDRLGWATASEYLVPAAVVHRLGRSGFIWVVNRMDTDLVSILVPDSDARAVPRVP